MGAEALPKRIHKCLAELWHARSAMRKVWRKCDARLRNAFPGYPESVNGEFLMETAAESERLDRELTSIREAIEELDAGLAPNSGMSMEDRKQAKKSILDRLKQAHADSKKLKDRVDLVG